MPHQTIVFHGLLKQIPWVVFDRLVDEHNADWDDRMVKSKAHLIAMLYAQFCGARGLREIETNLKSHAGKLRHLGGSPMSRSTLSTANAQRPGRGVCRLAGGADRLVAGRLSPQNPRLRASDRFDLRAAERLERHWATFSTGVCGAKAHIVYDPDADQPLYLIVTPSNVNDITAAKQMPIEAGATYVFDLGYYDYGWWAEARPGGLPHRHPPQVQHPLRGRARIARCRRDRRS